MESLKSKIAQVLIGRIPLCLVGGYSLVKSLAVVILARVFHKDAAQPVLQPAGYLTSMARRETLPGRPCSSLCQMLVQAATTLSYLDTTVTQAQGLHY